MIHFGLIISSITELMEQWIWVGAFFLSPSRIYLLVVFGAAVLAHFWSRNTAPSGPEVKKYTNAVLVLLGISLISASLSQDLGYSIKRVLNATSVYLLPILICFYLRANEVNKDWSGLFKTIGRTICITGFWVALFGLLQSVTGILQHSNELRPVFGIPFRRINSLFPDPNFLGYFLVFPLWITLVGTAATSGIKSARSKWLIVAVISFAIFLTGSRGAQLMIAAAAYSYFMDRIFKSRPKLLMAFEIPLVVLFPLALILFATFGFEFLWSRVASYDNGTESAFSRVLSWYAGIKIYLNSPWLGVGPGNFVTMDKGIYLPYNYVPPWVALKISALAGHSNVVETLVEIGPFGLAAYFWMQFRVYSALLKAQITRPDFAIYRSLYLAAALGNSLISYFPIFLMIMIGALLYLVDIKPKTSKCKADKPIVNSSSRLRNAALGCVGPKSSNDQMGVS